MWTPFASLPRPLCATIPGPSLLTSAESPPLLPSSASSLHTVTAPVFSIQDLSHSPNNIYSVFGHTHFRTALENFSLGNTMAPKGRWQGYSRLPGVLWEAQYSLGLGEKVYRMESERRLFSHCPDNYFVGGYWVGTYSIEFKIRSKLKTGFWKWNSNPKT